MHKARLASVLAFVATIGMLPAGSAAGVSGGRGPAAGCGASATADAGASPAGGGWTSSLVRTLGDSGNEGGLAVADDLHATIVTMDDEVSWAIPTTDGAPPGTRVCG